MSTLDAALGSFPRDLNWLVHQLHFGYLTKREHTALFRPQRQALHRRGGRPGATSDSRTMMGVRRFAFDQRANFRTGQSSFDEAIQVVCMDVELPQGFAVRLNFDHRILADTVELRFAASWDAAQIRCALLRRGVPFRRSCRQTFCRQDRRALLP